MANKKLSITLSALIALSLIETQNLYAELIGAPAPETLSKDELAGAILDVADPLEEVTEEIPDECFRYEGKLYKVLFPSVIIPGLGLRTKVEICDDEDAQKHLVKQGCIGSVIEEIK